jgi:ethanolamine utilization protein EutN
MVLGRVVGKATSTIKHASYNGAKMLVVDPIRALSLDPVLCFDELGSRAGDLVVMSNDGQYAREMLNDNQSPGRWWVMGIIDNAEEIDRKTQ